MKPQMRTEFERDLAELRSLILQMGERIVDAVEEAMRSLEANDLSRAQRVIDGDAEINDLRFQIEEMALAAIARQQPAAKDLRVIVAALNIVLDLERMGDHAAGIAKTVDRMAGEDHSLQPPASLRKIHAMALGMLQDVLQTYRKLDPQRAKELARRDDHIDDQYRQLFRELLQTMAEDPVHTERGLYLLFAGHNLERIADRVTNVAERVVFIKSGEMKELNVDLEDSDPT